MTRHISLANYTHNTSALYFGVKHHSGESVVNCYIKEMFIFFIFLLLLSKMYQINSQNQLLECPVCLRVIRAIRTDHSTLQQAEKTISKLDSYCSLPSIGETYFFMSK